MEQVQGRPRPEPFELGGPERMLERERFEGSVGVPHATLHGLAWGQIRQPYEADAIVFTDAVIVRRVLKRQGQESLLLEIRLVDAGEAPRDHGRPAEEPWRESGVLAAAPLAIVVVAHDDPFDPLGLVVPGNIRDGLAG